jgi:hypothetical protein
VARPRSSIDPDPGAGRRRADDPKARADAEIAAEIEAVDIDQMIEARNERRRRAGRLEIGEELAREALRRER